MNRPRFTSFFMCARAIWLHLNPKLCACARSVSDGVERYGGERGNRGKGNKNV